MAYAHRAIYSMNVLKGAQSAKAQFVCFAALDILWKKENVLLFMEIQSLDVETILHKTHVSCAKRDT